MLVDNLLRVFTLPVTFSQGVGEIVLSRTLTRVVLASLLFRSSEPLPEQHTATEPKYRTSKDQRECRSSDYRTFAVSFTVYIPQVERVPHAVVPDLSGWGQR